MFFIIIIIRLPPEFLPVLGPLTRWCASILGTALLCSSRAGYDLGLVSRWGWGLCKLGSQLNILVNTNPCFISLAIGQSPLDMGHLTQYWIPARNNDYHKSKSNFFHFLTKQPSLFPHRCVRSSSRASGTLPHRWSSLGPRTPWTTSTRTSPSISSAKPSSLKARKLKIVVYSWYKLVTRFRVKQFKS